MRKKLRHLAGVSDWVSWDQIGQGLLPKVAQEPNSKRAKVKPEHFNTFFSNYEPIVRCMLVYCVLISIFK